MKLPMLLVAVAAVAFQLTAHAAPPADAPAGATALCKDGSYFDGAKKQGACRGHKGLKTWFGDDAAANNKTTANASEKKTAAVVPAVPAVPVVPAPAASAPTKRPEQAITVPSTSKSASVVATKTAAPGGGAGKVWVNTSTKTYHCSNDRWYGKTKTGEYESEATAKANGFHAAQGKTCAS